MKRCMPPHIRHGSQEIDLLDCAASSMQDCNDGLSDSFALLSVSSSPNSLMSSPRFCGPGEIQEPTDIAVWRLIAAHPACNEAGNDDPVFAGFALVQPSEAA